MKKQIVTAIVAVIMVFMLGITSVCALGYTGTNNVLVPGDSDTYSDAKTSTGRYVAVNTKEGYPNPGQLIGPSSLKWICYFIVEEFNEGLWVHTGRRMYPNSRDSVWLYDDQLAVGSNYYFIVENDSSVNATYGMTYSANATS